MHCIALFLSVLIGGTSVATAQAITVSITAPMSGRVVNGALNVTATVQSTYDLTEVRASVSGEAVVLSRSGTQFQGTVQTSALPSGPYVLTVTATDVFGTTGTAQRTFILDRLPILAPVQPIDYSVTRGPVSADASCSDAEGACTLTVTAASQTLTGTGSVSGTFDLSAFNGSSVGVRFDAVDARGQLTRTVRLVYVESNPRWRERQSVVGVIDDVTTDRVLVGVESVRGTITAWRRAQIVNRLTGAVSEIPIPATEAFQTSYQRRYSRLTPYGAIFALDRGTGGAYPYTSLYDWNEGQLYPLGDPKSATSLSVAGGYATWVEDPAPGGEAGTSRLLFRDMAARTTVLVAPNSTSNNGFAPAEDGRIGYSTGYSSSTSYLYKDGTSSLFAGGDALLERYDGGSTYYLDRRASPAASLWVYDNASGYRRVIDNLAWATYEVSGGWIAFARQGNLGQTHVWLRSPAGVESQLSFFSAPSELEAVSPTGEVIFTSSNRRYWATPEHTAQDIGPKRGRIQWLGSEWTLSLGRTLLGLTPTGAVASEDAPEPASRVRVMAAYPNPVHSTFTLSYDLPRPLTVHVWVVDALGRKVAELDAGDRTAGPNRVQWDVRTFASGRYTVLLGTADGQVGTPVTIIR